MSATASAAANSLLNVIYHKTQKEKERERDNASPDAILKKSSQEQTFVSRSQKKSV
jgi:hypothetical protein